MKRWKFSQEKLEIMLKKRSLNKIYRFSQEELEVVPKKKGLAKKNFKKFQKKKKLNKI
jgi:hypothetical protein